MFIDNLSPEDLLILTNAVAISFIKDRNLEEINVLGNFFVGVGGLILTFAAQQQYITSQKENNKPNTNEQTIG